MRHCRGPCPGGPKVPFRRLLTTPYLEEADRPAQRIAVIDQGRLISEGTRDGLKDRVGGAVVELTVADADRTRT
jgi:ABC-2 type transport system ATP-binding protein